VFFRFVVDELLIEIIDDVKGMLCRVADIAAAIPTSL
jgi:hypothetical protein